MAYRFDQTTGSFIQTGEASPVSRRRPAPATIMRAEPPRQPEAQPARKQERVKKKSKRREQAGGMTYDPATGEFLGQRKRKTRAVTPARTTVTRQQGGFNPAATPPIAHQWGNPFQGRRLAWFMERVMSRVAVYIVAGFIISTCSRIFR